MNVPPPVRLAIPLIVLSMLLLGLSVGAAAYVHNIQQTESEIVRNHMASVRAAFQLELNLRKFRGCLYWYLREGDRRRLGPVPEIREQIENWLKVAEDLAYTEEEKQQVQAVRRGYATFVLLYGRLIEPPFAKDAWEKYHEQVDTFFQHEFIDPIESYRLLNQRNLERDSLDNDRTAQKLVAGLIGLGVCGAAAGLLIGWLIASSVRRSMLRTERQLRYTAMQLNRVAGGKGGSGAAVPAEGELDEAVESVSRSAVAILEQLSRSQRDALRAEQLAYVGQMAAGIAHEVRNPLMAMKILVQKASEQPPERPLPQKDLRVLEGEIERVERIITHFLEFARPPRIEKRMTEARPLLERVVGSLRARAEQQQVELNLATPPGPVFFDVDAGQIQQVFYNLVLNALDALPMGGEITIGLGVAQSHPEVTPTVVISVSDNGPGLPLALGERIFEPFISSKEAGMGLGLSICARIVQAHGGEISGADRPEGGAVFTVRLRAASAKMTSTV